MCRFYFKYGGIYRVIIALLLLLGAFHSNELQAQFSSQKGWFEANFTVGCEELAITITHTRSGSGALFYAFEGDPNDPLNSNFEGSFNEGETANHTYTAAGTYYIIVIDQSGSGTVDQRSDRIEIVVLPDDPPSATYTNCQGNTVQITIDKANDPFDYYNVLWGNGDQQQYSGDAPIEYTYATPGVYEIFIGGRLNDGESSGCRLLRIEVSTFESLPTPNLTEITVQDQTEIEISYDDLSAGLNYTLQIDRGSGFEDYTTIDPSANPNSILLNDAAFNTVSEYYAFKLIVEDACGSQSEESQEGYSIAFDIGQQNVTNQFEMDVSWATSPTDFNSIELFKDGDSFITYNNPDGNESLTFPNCEELGVLFMQTLTNGIVSTSISESPFENTPIVFAAPAAPDVELTGAVVEIDFPPTDFPLGEYGLYRKDITDSFNEVFSSSSSSHTDTTIPPGTAEVCYRLAYRDRCGNLSELSEEICIVLSSSLGIPNAFSPNGDGINDIFKINDGIYANFNILIYNRWGNLVFHSVDPSQGWDGQFEGQPATSGTYLYRISFQNADNLLITKTGSFVLIR